MHKDELIYLHSLMAQIKDYYAEEHGATFEKYAESGTTPTDVHKAKEKHKYAVFVLGQELAEYMTEDEFSEIGRVGQRMKELVEKNSE